jgi:FkbH-like protein
MKLLEAMQIINEARRSGHPTRTFALACGFTPLAVETFLGAHLQRRSPGVTIDLHTGQFGDLAGNLDRAATRELEGAAVIVEWGDLDPRLGYRHAAAMASPEVAADVAATVEGTLARLAPKIEALAARTPVALCLPTLPLPPIFITPGHHASAAELRLRGHVARFAEAAAGMRGVRVVSDQRLDAESPPGSRHDVASDIRTGFPYQRAHAERVAGLLAALLRPTAAKKGLISDLDNTFWQGILGEVGVQGVSWSLERGSQVHALYQQFLASLAASGVLVAIASKNDTALVEEAFRREDLLADCTRFFPVHANWGAKSESVRAILQAWNVGADSVVFVDDSPMEIAEVQARFPEVEGHLFTPEDPAAVVALIARLRDAFGKEVVREEDQLRAASLRAAATTAAAERESGTDVEGFLSGVDAVVRVEIGRDVSDARALELLNKTNQFNLNGRRVSEAQWRQRLDRDDAFLLTVSYQDKFGPLGKIAVATGRRDGETVHVDSWVMSCRAFARRIEDQTLRTFFSELGAEEVVLDFAPTERNGPLRDALAVYGIGGEQPGVRRLERARFERHCPTLYHRTDIRRSDGVAAAESAG